MRMKEYAYKGLCIEPDYSAPPPIPTPLLNTTTSCYPGKELYTCIDMHSGQCFRAHKLEKLHLQSNKMMKSEGICAPSVSTPLPQKMTSMMVCMPNLGGVSKLFFF